MRQARTNDPARSLIGELRAWQERCAQLEKMREQLEQELRDIADYPDNDPVEMRRMARYALSQQPKTDERP